MKKIERLCERKKPFEIERVVLESIPCTPSWLSDRVIARSAPTHQQQLRLIVGPLQLVLATPSAVGRPAMWALPGGARASTAQLLALARRNGWKRPVQIEVTIRHAPDTVSQETHGD